MSRRNAYAQSFRDWRDYTRKEKHISVQYYCLNNKYDILQPITLQLGLPCTVLAGGSAALCVNEETSNTTTRLHVYGFMAQIITQFEKLQ